MGQEANQRFSGGYWARLFHWVFVAWVGLFSGFAGAALWDISGWGASSTRDYLMENPEVLPEAIEVLQAREDAKRIDPMRADLERPFPGAVLGNPSGSVTLVEFSDYACSYCRKSVADVEALIAANPDLKVVVREYPILHPQSVAAARMALAAAQQGRYGAFHHAMYQLGPPSPQSIDAAARQAGVDLAEANKAIASGQFDAHLQVNMRMAQVLGVKGTPGWVAGDRILNGAMGRQAISDVVEAARAS